MADFGNLKGVVKDLVVKQTKFGSFKASKNALQKKYRCFEYDSNNTMFLNSYGERVAWARTPGFFQEISISQPNGYNFYYRTRENPNGYTTTKCPDKFVTMGGYDQKSGCSYRIHDSNNNGFVDKEDRIEIFEYEAASIKDQEENKSIVKTIAEFLGL